MRQEAKAQLPGIDLTFDDGRNGRIWGISGIDDLRGSSFVKAEAYLKALAERQNDFNWVIAIQLDQMVSSSFRPLLDLLKALDDLVVARPSMRTATVHWYVNASRDNMRVIAEEMKDSIERRPGKRRALGLTIEIFDDLSSGFVVPGSKAAAITPLWEGSRLRLSSGPAISDLNEAEFAAAVTVLNEEFNAFGSEVFAAAGDGTTNIDKRFGLWIKQFAEKMRPYPLSQLELFRLGHAVEFLSGYTETVGNEWPSFLATRHHALLYQANQTLLQSPVWRQFKSNARSFGDEEIITAASLAVEIVDASRGAEATKFIDRSVPDALALLAEPIHALKVTHVAEQPGEPGMRLLANDVIESANNILKRVARALTDIVAEVGGLAHDYAKSGWRGFKKSASKQATKDGELAFKWLRRIVISALGGGAGAAGISASLRVFPDAFGWLSSLSGWLELVRPYFG
jgi:hypothetical protein